MREALGSLVMDLATSAAMVYDYIVNSDLVGECGDMFIAFIVTIYDLGLYKCSLHGLFLLLLFRVLFLAIDRPDLSSNSTKSNDAQNKKIDWIVEMSMTAVTLTFTAILTFAPPFHKVDMLVNVYFFLMVLLAISVAYVGCASDLDRRLSDQQKRVRKLRLNFGELVVISMMSYTGWNIDLWIIEDFTVVNFTWATIILVLVLGALTTVYYARMIGMDDKLTIHQKKDRQQELFFNSGGLLINYVYIASFAYDWSSGTLALLKSLDNTVLYLISCLALFGVFSFSITNANRQLTSIERRKLSFKIVYNISQFITILGLFYSLTHLFRYGVLFTMLILIGNSMAYDITTVLCDYHDIKFEWLFENSVHEVHPMPEPSPEDERIRRSPIWQYKKAVQRKEAYARLRPWTPPGPLILVPKPTPSWSEEYIWAEPQVVKPPELLPSITLEEPEEDELVKPLTAMIERWNLKPNPEAEAKEALQEQIRAEAKLKAKLQRRREDEALPNFKRFLAKIEREAQVDGPEAAGIKSRYYVIREIERWDPLSRPVSERLRDYLERRFREYATEHSLGEAALLYLKPLSSVSDSLDDLKNLVDHLRAKEAFEQEQARRLKLQQEEEEKQRMIELHDKPALVRRIDRYAAVHGLPTATRKFHDAIHKLYGAQGMFTCLVQVSLLQAQRKVDKALKTQNLMIEIRTHAFKDGYRGAKRKFSKKLARLVDDPAPFWKTLRKDVYQLDADMMKEKPEMKDLLFRHMKIEMFSFALLTRPDKDWGYGGHAVRKEDVLHLSKRFMYNKYGGMIKALGDERPGDCFSRLCEEVLREHFRRWMYLSRETYFIGKDAAGIPPEKLDAYVNKKKHEVRSRRAKQVREICEKIGLSESMFWQNVRDQCELIPARVRKENREGFQKYGRIWYFLQGVKPPPLGPLRLYGGRGYAG